MKLQNLFTAILVVFATFAQSAYAQSAPSELLKLPEQLINRNAIPNFAARDGDGQNLFNKRHLEKLVGPETKRVALVYFATWCMPCAKGAAELRKARNELKKRGVLAVFVNVGEKDAEAVRKWIRQYGGPDITLITDPKLQLAGPFGLLEPDGNIIMPKTLVLDAKLKPLFLLGAEGNDFPEVLWKYNP